MDYFTVTCAYYKILLRRVFTTPRRNKTLHWTVYSVLSMPWRGTSSVQKRNTTITMSSSASKSGLKTTPFLLRKKTTNMLCFHCWFRAKLLMLSNEPLCALKDISKVLKNNPNDFTTTCLQVLSSRSPRDNVGKHITTLNTLLNMFN